MLQQSQSAEWVRFRVGTPLNDPTHPRWENDDCKVLEAVYHVAHIGPALQILADGQIKAVLVSDESRLNTERVLVTWVSPNNWARGFRYGNVRFQFKWAELVRGLNYYWVESIAYGVDACRILITERDHDDTLASYDPTAGNGPWWHDAVDDKHYWNGEYCLELMLEMDLNLDRCNGVDFVKHHPHQCSIDHRTCRFRGLEADEASALFVAGVVSQGIDPQLLGFTVEDQGQVSPNDSLLAASCRIREDMREATPDYSGDVEENSSAASSLILAILDAYAQSRETQWCDLASLFDSQEALLRACTEAINDAFRVTNGDDF